jgi:hypothetical protein
MERHKAHTFRFQTLKITDLLPTIGVRYLLTHET